MANQFYNYAIAIGSNLSFAGKSNIQIVADAIAELNTQGCTVTAISRFVFSQSYPDPNDPPFVNAACTLRTRLHPNEIIERLHMIEHAFERKRKTRWAARSLDLDLLLQEGSVLPNKKTVSYWINLPLIEQQQRTPECLILPHPRIQDRAFVLGPLCDVAAGTSHPISNKTIYALWGELHDDVKDGMSFISFKS